MIDEALVPGPEIPAELADDEPLPSSLIQALHSRGPASCHVVRESQTSLALTYRNYCGDDRQFQLAWGMSRDIITYRIHGTRQGFNTREIWRRFQSEPAFLGHGPIRRGLGRDVTSAIRFEGYGDYTVMRNTHGRPVYVKYWRDNPQDDYSWSLKAGQARGVGNRNDKFGVIWAEEEEV